MPPRTAQSSTRDAETCMPGMGCAHRQAIWRHGLASDPALLSDGIAIILPKEDTPPRLVQTAGRVDGSSLVRLHRASVRPAAPLYRISGPQSKRRLQRGAAHSGYQRAVPFGLKWPLWPVADSDANGLLVCGIFPSHKVEHKGVLEPLARDAAAARCPGEPASSPTWQPWQCVRQTLPVH